MVLSHPGFLHGFPIKYDINSELGLPIAHHCMGHTGIPKIEGGKKYRTTVAQLDKCFLALKIVLVYFADFRSGDQRPVGGRPHLYPLSPSNFLKIVNFLYTNDDGRTKRTRTAAERHSSAAKAKYTRSVQFKRKRHGTSCESK